MRFEAKHRYFKRLASYIGNHKNVAYTLATRHQGQQCYLMNVKEKDDTLTSFIEKPTAVGR